MANVLSELGLAEPELQTARAVPPARPLAVVTGASSGIGLELARCCAEHGFDLVAAAYGPELDAAAATLRESGASVEAVQTDLATADGVARLLAAVGARPVDALLANAGRGLGGAFVDQNFAQVRHIIDTNITGTLDLVQQVARAMQARGSGRIMFTGSIAGFLPGTYQAVYNATKSFIDSFSYALRNELKDTGVSVTCLMPGLTESDFFERADMLDTRIARRSKDDPAEVARIGFEAMLRGEAEVIPGWMNKMRAAIARLTPGTVLAEGHRHAAQPGSGAP